jgi:hypothetical protein
MSFRPGIAGKPANVLLLVVIFAILPAVICAIVLAGKALGVRNPRELRGDWWPQFEREFRAYARRNGHRYGRPQS